MQKASPKAFLKTLKAAQLGLKKKSCPDRFLNPTTVQIKRENASNSIFHSSTKVDLNSLL